jgi:hypothetical protein
VGTSRTRGPKPFTQHQISTVFLRVPRGDWIAVKRGLKREFRAGSGAHSRLWNVATPTPAVAYTIDGMGEYRHALLVLEKVWREPLGAISPESLAAEGFESFAAVRRHWVLREKRYFPPLRMTTAYQVRPWADADADLMGEQLLKQLYGDFLPDDRDLGVRTFSASRAAL